MRRLLFCFLLCFYSSQSVYTFEFNWKFVEGLYCSFSEFLSGFECCRSARVDFKHLDFKIEVKKRLFGQPVAIEFVTNAISSHWNSKIQPHKALALMLYGPTGTGKTYITRILAEYTFARGHKSQFYHFFSAMVHFPHKGNQDAYIDQLRNWIVGNVSYCEKSVFVFDEVEKMPVQILDSLKPFMDYNSVIDGADFGRSIFILLSNIGSEMIVKKMVSWKLGGRHRDNFPIAEDREFAKHAFADDESSLKDSALLRHQLISRFIAFLPLEMEHVLACLRSHLIERNREYLFKDQKFVQSVVSQIPSTPEKEKFFSTFGCKRVAEKADVAVEMLAFQRSDL